MENFQTIKKKYLIAAIISSVALGVLCGVGLTCTLAVVFKRLAVDFSWALYIPVALVIAAGFGALFFLILRPTDHRIAKKLDKDFGLKQKVQTMVEFRGDDGAMAQLQREQADEVLGGIAKKRVDLKWLLKFLFVPVLAVAMLFAGIFVPANKRTEAEEPPYNITETQLAALKNLIADVKESQLKKETKDSTVSVLDTLLQGLQDEQPQSVMRAAVISSVKMIDTIIASGNSYSKLYESLSREESLTRLAGMLVSGATYYTGGGSQISTLAGVKSKFLSSDEEIGRILDRWRATFMQDYRKPVEGGQEEAEYLTVPEMSGKLFAYVQTLEVRLNATDYAQKEEAGNDGLYLALNSLRVKLYARSQNTGNMSPRGYYGSIEGDIKEFGQTAVVQLANQAYNCMMDEFIRNALARIFNINVAEFGSSDAVITNPSQGDDPDDGKWTPGENPGELIYGSDDLVLNVNYDGSDGSKKQVPYGEVLNEYNRIISELIGNRSDDVAAFITQYFQILYSGIKDEQ